MQRAETNFGERESFYFTPETCEACDTNHGNDKKA
jgi:hypothetical protein